MTNITFLFSSLFCCLSTVMLSSMLKFKMRERMLSSLKYMVMLSS